MAGGVRKYRLKVYLNASRVVATDGGKSGTEPFSWEFSLLIQTPPDRELRFSKAEEAIREYLAPYQNVVLDEQPLFADCTPSLEQVTERFARGFSPLVSGAGGVLLEVEASKTPTKSYILQL